MPRLGGRAPGFDVICGTSVGAINAVYLAAHAHAPAPGVRRLTDLWSGLELQHVVRFGVLEAMRLPKVLWGGGEAAQGVFDVRPLIELVTKEVPWRAIGRAISRGYLRALAVSATEIATGRTAVFMDAHPEMALPTQLGPRSHVVPGPIGPQHALASAASRWCFPRALGLDALLRRRAAAEHAHGARAARGGVEALGDRAVSRGEGRRVPEGKLPTNKAPGAPFLFFARKLSQRVRSTTSSPTSSCSTASTSSSTSGVLCTALTSPTPSRAKPSDAARAGTSPSTRSWCARAKTSAASPRITFVAVGFPGPLITRKVLAMLESGVNDEADLASYLLFDGAFCRRLIELGRADAHARRHELASFFDEP